jgi:DNA-binding transcriptional ArsR family regulator
MPESEFSVTELAKLIEASASAVGQEVDRLVSAGLLDSRRRGNLRLVRRAAPHALTAPLTDLMAASYGPAPVLSDELSGIGGIDKAYIYGSWAARRAGEIGPVPGDIDVLVIGDPSPDDLDSAARRAQRRLHRTVNIYTVTGPAWEEPRPEDSFMMTVKSQPLIELRLPTTAMAPS